MAVDRPDRPTGPGGTATNGSSGCSGSLRRRPFGDADPPRVLAPARRRQGDRIPYSPFNSIPVVAIAPERYLIIDNSVAWVLQDLGDGRTRLIVRTRGHGWFKALFLNIPVLRQCGGVIDYVVGEPLHHYVEKRVYIGIANRAASGAGAPDMAIAVRWRPGKHVFARRRPLIGDNASDPAGHSHGSQGPSHARVVLDRVLHGLRALGGLHQAV